MKRILRKGLYTAVAAVSALIHAQEEPSLARGEERLGPAPTKPAWPTHQAFLKAADQTSFTNFLVITNRETSRQFFNLVYSASENVPMEWSGSYATSNPGTNSAEYLQGVLRRVNYFRAMAGVPAGITFNSEYSRKAQAAALMMGGNNQLNHYPPTSWLYYTADGAEAAQNSNLSLGNAGPQAVVGQMRDNGGNNAVAGHRRWIVYPQTQIMGSGSVPQTGPSNSASALWVFDTHTFDARPPTREAFVSWPPPGYVPYQVTYARWSFAYPNADFSQATVSMTSNSVPLSVMLESPANGYGENTLVWIPAGLDANTLPSFARPVTNTVYHVTVNNVRISNVPYSYSYDVNVFDPAVAGPDYFPPTITGTNQPLVGAGSVYSFAAVSNANAYEVRSSRPTNSTFVDGAENGVTNFTVQAATNLYNVRDSAVKFAGTYSFHLTHTQAMSQMLTLNRLFLAASNSSLQFQSRLGWATAYQVAKVQISLDEGSSWADLYSQAGNGGSGEANFAMRTVSLAAYTGNTFRLRLNYDLSPASYYPQATSGVGWYIDNFTVTNATELLSPVVNSTTGGSTFTFSPTNVGSHLLEVRPILFGDYPSQWGPALTVNATPNTNVVIRITRIQKTGGTTWHIDFILQSGNPSGYELWSANSLPSAFAREISATIQTVVPGSQYRAVINSTGTNKFFQIKPL